ncbi:cytochrome P450 [Podospora australis]|uniref:Cytochrome P450 n=1 Tax=Podospora australis TaxID=1536484 RepID=A0AAN6WUN1_9PEZI|nr:cytochrome P450 [Podospora australis]
MWIPFAYHFFAADHPRWLSSLHGKYGPVVRIAPNELAFISPQAFRDIYGFRGRGHGVFTKSGSYDAAAFTAQTRSIVNERDPAEHARMRKMLAPAFSDRALRDQWPLISAATETLITEIEKYAKNGQPFDLAQYLSCITFDIITNLALGESFDSVTAGKVHPWQVFFLNGARAMGEALAVARFPLLKRLVIALQPPPMGAMMKELRRHEEFTVELVKKRQQSQVDRPDIIGLILNSQDKEGTEYSPAFMAAQMSDVVIAGTDTTSTALGSANYHLMANPQVMETLRTEIRSRFEHYEDITPETTSNLPYLNAVLSEALRIFAPVSWPPSRIVPPGGDTVDGYHLPAGTWVSAGYYTGGRSPENFQDPLTFWPERWLAEVPTDKLDASQPFGMGTRGCIGKQ